jgi:hypothetical protein
MVNTGDVDCTTIPLFIAPSATVIPASPTSTTLLFFEPASRRE